MITNKRDLANKLSNNGKINFSEISKKLHKTIEMWISYGDVKKNNNIVIGNF